MLSLFLNIKLYPRMSSPSTAQFILRDYRVGTTIGKGTFGKVHLATHLPTSSKVAVKTLEKSKINQDADIQRVTRQICILKKLHHPNIAQLYQIIETSTDIHLVMQYAQGGQLFDYIVKKKRLQESQAVRIMQQLLSGLEYIHQSGVVHRDLKPQNLLLDQNKNVKIVDFGLSNQFGPGERLKTACGSPCYAAPQMIAGRKYQCSGVDVWSSGVILYAMLCGFLPFQDANTNKLYKKILAGKFEVPKLLSSSSVQVLKGILNTNPEWRWKIDHIKKSKLFTQSNNKYNINGILIGRDQFQLNQKVIHMMKDKGFDPTTVRNYVSSNRHNNITAFYYLLKKQLEKDPSLYVDKNGNKNHAEVKRSDSPLIYRPEFKKAPVVVFKKKKIDINSSQDNSMNATAIVRSLEANKDKIPKEVINNVNKGVKKGDVFDRVEDFKLFPKKKPSFSFELNNSLNFSDSKHKHSKAEQLLQSSGHRPSSSFAYERPQPQYTTKPVSTQIQTPKSTYNSHFEPFPHTPINHNQQLQKSNHTVDHNSQTSHGITPISSKNIKVEHSDIRFEDMSKKRQEISNQLKQISNRIDQSIYQLRKQNDSGMTNSTCLATPPQKHKESTSIHEKPTRERIKTQVASSPANTNITFSFSPSKPPHLPSFKHKPTFSEVKDPSFSSPFQPKTTKQIKTCESPLPKATAKVHMGPFNANHLFFEDHRNLIMKIQLFLRRQGLTYLLLNPFGIKTGETTIQLLSLQGMVGLYLIQFDKTPSWGDKLIQHLNK